MQGAKSLFATVGVVSLAALALTGCTGSTSDSSGGDTVTIALSSTIPSLDPQAGYDNPSRAILYDGGVSEPLYSSDAKTGAPIPVLATGVTSPSPTEYDFAIRQGVKFQNGEPFNAEAAAFSIKRFLDPDTKALGVGFLSPVVKDAVAVGDDTLKITTFGPAANLTRLLAAVNMVPPKYAVSTPTALAEAPVGTGPYEFASRTPDSVTLKINPTYWGTKPTIKTVKFVSLPEDAGRMAALQTGQVDIVHDVPTTSVKDAPAVVTQTKPEVLHLRFNAAKGLTENAQFRKALNLATDRETLRKSLLGDKYSTPIQCQFAYQGVTGFNPDLKEQTYDLDQAKQIIKDLGDTGKTVTVALSRDRYGAESVQYMQALASAWEGIGLKVDLKITDTQTWINTLKLGPNSPEVTLVGVDVDQFDVGQPLSQMVLPQSAVAAYDPKSLDETVGLINQANAATTPEDRDADLQKAAVPICQSDSFDFLYFSDFIYGKQKNVDWTHRVDGQIHLDTLRFTS